MLASVRFRYFAGTKLIHTSHWEENSIRLEVPFHVLFSFIDCDSKRVFLNVLHNALGDTLWF